jgi:hypothetical protein
MTILAALKDATDDALAAVRRGPSNPSSEVLP